MQSVKKSATTVYDYAVIGSGLSGLCIANALSKVSNNVILIEAADTFGGQNRSIQSKVGPLNNGLRFLPDTELSQKAVAFLETLLATHLAPESLENPVVSFEAGGLKPFVGFGEKPPAFYDELSYFLNNRQLKLTLEPHEWTPILFNNYSGQFLPRSYVTKFQIENKKVTGVMVNGQKTIQATNFIFCGAVGDLKTLLPDDILSSRMLQKLSKNTYWTAVCLDLFHNHEVTVLPNLHVLNGTTEDELGPCLGSFLPANEINGQKIQCSQWISFVDNEESEDSEKAGAALKKIKRQIKRAYPNALENLIFERILIVPNHSGNGDLKLSANGTLPNTENLWIASPAMHQQKNILGALLQAEFILSSLGCHPLGTQVEVKSPDLPQERPTPDLDI